MEKSLVANAADSEQVKKAERKESYAKDRETQDLKAVLSTAQGRAIFHKYLDVCGVFKTSYSESVNRTMYLEGMRNVGLMMIADIHSVDPELYILMMKEAREGR